MHVAVSGEGDLHTDIAGPRGLRVLMGLKSIGVK